MPFSNPMQGPQYPLYDSYLANEGKKIRLNQYSIKRINYENVKLVI